ncbi:hypothetical protein JW964_21495 [candidate division KSB1 bacterium]|nr:hypothetical protein [candidate division KSB1 bacterium]
MMCSKTPQALCYLMLLLLFVNWLPAQSKLPIMLDSLLQQSVEFTIRQNYAGAESTGLTMMKQYPEHPLGYLFMAATLQSKMLDYETDSFKDIFFNYLDKAEHFAKQAIAQDPQNPMNYFYSGSTFCYRAFYAGKQNQILQAYWHISNGIEALEKAVKLDSTIYDAYLGIGSYLFWKSQKMHFLNWLPLIKDERAKGIGLIQKTTEKGKYSRFAAINALAWIYIELKQYDNAIEIANTGEKAFPQSRYFKWCLAEANFRNKNYMEAIHHFRALLNSVTSENFNNHYNEVVCHQKLGESYFYLSQYEKALYHCQKIEMIHLDSNTHERLKKRMEKVAQLKNECQSRLKPVPLSQAE